jgi:hypothetical protein
MGKGMGGGAVQQMMMMQAKQDQGVSAADVKAAAAKRVQTHDNEMSKILVYIVFLFLFTVQSTRALTEPDYYFFAANLKSQFIGVEFLPQHSPTFGKTFDDITTVEEFYNFLEGPFIYAAFSPNTFDGDSAWNFKNGSQDGTVSGYNKVIGAVRITQLRSKPHTCASKLAVDAKLEYDFNCYGALNEMWIPDGDFSSASEQTHDFGLYAQWNTSATPARITKSLGAFVYDGMQAVDGTPLPESASVATRREAFLSDFTSKKTWQNYPASAFALTIPPTVGHEAAKDTIRNIINSRYIDLHTRAVFVDVNVYNPMIDRVCVIRMGIEITKAGGALPQSEFEVFRLYEATSARDRLFVGLKGVVALFYVYYGVQLVRRYKRQGKKIFWTQGLNLAEMFNIISFCTEAAFMFYAENLIGRLEVNGGDFLQLWPVARFKAIAQSIGGVNVFLNWFKLISYLSYAPNFRLINNTLVRSAHDVAGFFVVFFVLMFGFAQAHTMVFSTKIAAFRTISMSILSLLRSLLGDFDFTELQMADPYMGPLFFILFVVLAVFVVLNVLIAIIANAYDASRAEMQGVENMNLLSELGTYISQRVKNRFCRFRRRTVHNDAHDDGAGKGETTEASDGAIATPGGPAADGSTQAVELPTAVEAENNASVSDLILAEWYDSLKQNEEDMEHVQADVESMSTDIAVLKRDMRAAVDQIGELSDGITQVLELLKNTAQPQSMIPHGKGGGKGGGKNGGKGKGKGGFHGPPHSIALPASSLN